MILFILRYNVGGRKDLTLQVYMGNISHFKKTQFTENLNYKTLIGRQLYAFPSNSSFYKV